jgi:predicted DNA-binding ribbon-helix-helix protein
MFNHTDVASFSPTTSTPKSETKISSLVSRNVTVGKNRTSIRLEPAMWTAFKDLCKRERLTMHRICTLVAQTKQIESSLTAALRVFVMEYFRHAATEDGHAKAEHGNGMIQMRMQSMVPASTTEPAAPINQAVAEFVHPSNWTHEVTARAG